VNVGGIFLTEELVAQLQGIGAPTNNVYKNGQYISNDTKTYILATLDLADNDMRNDWMDDQENKIAYIKEHMGDADNIESSYIKKDYQRIVTEIFETMDKIRSKRNFKSINERASLRHQESFDQSRYHRLYNEVSVLKEKIEQSISQDEHASATRDQVH
jgi:hypothetical protein